MAKVAYLTIDDSPSKDMKEKVDLLVSKAIPAIWFCRGSFMENNLQAVAYAIERGFEIGNHSYHHPYFSRISLEECREEILKTESLIEEAYRLSSRKRPSKLFRFPFGDRGGGKDDLKNHTDNESQKIQALQEFLAKEGFQQPLFQGIRYPHYLQAGWDRAIDAGWTFDVKEYVLIWENSRRKHGLYSLDDVLKRMDEDKSEEGLGLNDPSSNEIILIHDFAETTYTFQPIIEHLMTKDLTFQ